MNKVLLVTGASRGIGAAVALQAAAQGYHLAVNFTSNAQAARRVVEQAIALGVRAFAIQADVAIESQVKGMFQKVIAEFGRLDALVNNAGVVDHAARVDQMSFERLRRMFDINVLGAFMCAREAVLRMSTRHGGHGGVIVNLGSVASRLGGPGQYVDYAASKGAIDVLTLGLAREVATEGIRVNAVRPGIIETEIHASGGEPDRASEMAPLVPMKRAGSADEVANAVMWLLSDAASYTTGAVIDVAGGR